METNDIPEINQNPNFLPCESPVDALLSDAFKLWFISILKGWLMLPNNVANKIYISFKRLINWDSISSEDIEELENILFDESIIKLWEKYISWNLDVWENVINFNITANRIKEVLVWTIIKARINNIIDRSLRADDRYALNSDDMLKENRKEKWNKILENDNLYIYKLWEKFFIIYKDPKLKTEYDNIIYDDRYWYKMTKWIFAWILDKEWNEIIPCVNTNLIYDERYWFMIKQWNCWWILNKNWREIISCIYERIRYENWFFSVQNNNKKWIIDIDWKIIIKPIYDTVQYIKNIWFKVKNWKLHWLNDLEWGKIFADLNSEVEFIEWVGFIVDFWGHKWIFDIKLEQKVAFILDEVKYDEKYWFKVRQWKKWWIIDKNFNLILKCEYKEDDISYEETKKGWIVRVKRFIIWDRKIKVN